MRQQNTMYTGPLTDTETEHVHLQPEPYLIPYGHQPLPAGITFMAGPPGARVVPVPMTPGVHNHLSFINHIIDGPHNAFKGKITDGIVHVNFQYSYPAPGSSSGSNPFVVPEYRGFEVVPVVMGPGHYRGARNRAGGAIDVNPSFGLQFVPMSHGGQPLQMVPGPWLDQPFCGNALGIPYIQGYTNGNPVTFVHQPPPPMPPLPPMPRFVQHTPPPIGVRGGFQPHGQQLMIESTSRHRGFPHLRVLPEDGVAMLEFGNYGHRVDHHRDMRLDIDHMSYEELVALGEQIGNAGSGLSEDFIRAHLKTKTFTLSKSSVHLEDVSAAEKEFSFCTICQMDYNDEEKIGLLDCNHEYHVDCIHKWLIEKNTCPVCKCTGLATQQKVSGKPEEP